MQNIAENHLPKAEAKENFYDVMPLKLPDVSAGFDHFCLNKTLQIARGRQKGLRLEAAESCLREARQAAAQLKP